MIKAALADLLDGRSLTRERAREVMDEIMRGEATAAQIAGFLVALRLKGETVDEAERLAPSHLVVSPGPGRPADAGISVELIRRLGPRVPTLGVCRGHQAIVEAFGGEVGQAQRLVHGKASLVHHSGEGLFAGLPNPLEAGRYHSLAATRVPEELDVTARTDDGEIMGVRHREYPVDGIQFHPESVLTPHGRDLLATFLRGAR